MLKFVTLFKSALKVRIEAHSDNGVKSATKATRAQARAVRDWLVNEGKFKDGFFVPTGYGDQKSLASNATKAGKRTNRRVEIIIEH